LNGGMEESLPAHSVSTCLHGNNHAGYNLRDDVATFGIDVAAAQASGQQNLTVLYQLRSQWQKVRTESND